jgi:recombination protein RecA
MAAQPVLDQLRIKLESYKFSTRPSHDPGEGAQLALGWPELDALLPEGGLPLGVVELASSRGLGGATSVALCAARAVHHKNSQAWVAWLDPDVTLYAPGVRTSGVDLQRLLVIQPPWELVGPIAVKVSKSGAFEAIVVDLDRWRTEPTPRSSGGKKMWPREVLVRKLALAAEQQACRVLLLTHLEQSRRVPLPVGLRLELKRHDPATLEVRITKEKQGRLTGPVRVPLGTRPRWEQSSPPTTTPTTTVSVPKQRRMVDVSGKGGG